MTDIAPGIKPIHQTKISKNISNAKNSTPANKHPPRHFNHTKKILASVIKMSSTHSNMFTHNPALSPNPNTHLNWSK